MKLLQATFLTVAALALPLSQAQAQTVVNLDSSSGYIESQLDGSSPTLRSFGTSAEGNFIGTAGPGGSPVGRQPILAFALPTLDNAQLDSATITFSMRSPDAASSAPWFNVDAFGFTSAPTASDVFFGTIDPSKTLVADNVLTKAVSAGETITIDATTFIDTLYAGPYPMVSTVYFRLNPDDLLTAGDGIGRYRPLLVDGNGVSRTTLTLTAIPEL